LFALISVKMAFAMQTSAFLGVKAPAATKAPRVQARKGMVVRASYTDELIATAVRPCALLFCNPSRQAYNPKTYY
jgi:hypothetical protein